MSEGRQHRNDRTEVWRLSEGRVTLELDKYECGVIFHSLKDKRNQMLKELPFPER